MKQSQKITAQSSCRVDLAGGTLDIWPLYLFHPGAVTVNVAVKVMTHCTITPGRGNEIHLRSLDTGREEHFADIAKLRKSKAYKHPLAGHLCRFFSEHEDFPQQGFTLETTSESPAGAGISGSSALMIATTAALARFSGQRLSKEEIRVIAQNVEAQLIHVPTGCQDYYPALYGGVSAIHLTAGGIRREEIKVNPAEMDSRFLLVYTGAPRQSGINNWEVFKAHIGGDRKVFRNFESISAIARSMRVALSVSDWKEVARLLREEWKLRKTNAPGITTPLIERLVEAAMKSGANAAKICGAGGGGCMVLFVEPDAQARVANVVTAAGGKVLPFKVAPQGLKVT